MRFGGIKVETNGQQHIFEVEFYLNDIDPNAVRVELYADGVNGSSPMRQEMKRGRQLAGAVGGYIYSVAVSATRSATDYTARVTPNYDSVAVPLEAAHILWHEGKTMINQQPQQGDNYDKFDESRDSAGLPSQRAPNRG